MYYDGTKLLSMKDINGNRPEVYFCTSNRTAGKTTYFNRFMVNGFTKRHDEFVLLYRYIDDLKDCAEKFFKDIQGLFFPDYTLSSKEKAKGKYHNLYLTKDEHTELCGYAIALNSADSIKKYSHLFCNVKRILFDEFQSDTNTYCDNELRKFVSIHTSIARGNGDMVRYVPVYMVGNPVSIINPYYVATGICNRLDNKTRFLRGNGYVLEQGYNEEAAAQQLSSGFNQAFAASDYVAYAAQGIYLNDNLSFIEKPSGSGRYLATLYYQDNAYSIKAYDKDNIIYCDNTADNTFPVKIAVTTQDHSINYVMLRSNDHLIQLLRFYFEKGCFRFKTLKCKEMIMKLVSYR